MLLSFHQLISILLISFFFYLLWFFLSKINEQFLKSCSGLISYSIRQSLVIGNSALRFCLPSHLNLAPYKAVTLFLDVASCPCPYPLPKPFLRNLHNVYIDLFGISLNQVLFLFSSMIRFNNPLGL